MPRTDANTPDTQTIIDRLTEAAKPSSTGELYIRAATACRIIGVGSAQASMWIRQGRVTPMRFKVPRSRTAPFGLVTALPLDGVTTCVTRHWYHWTTDEDDFLLKHLGRKPREWIAEELGRTEDAVKRRATKLGVTQTDAQNLMTPGVVAGICRRSREAVRNWCLYQRVPLRYQTLHFGKRHTKLISINDLVKFLDAHPLIWNRLSSTSRRMIERMARDVTAPTCKRDTSRPEPRIYRTSEGVAA